MDLRAEIEESRALLRQVHVLIDSARHDVEQREKWLNEDVAFLEQAPYWRRLVAYPDMQWAIYKYKKSVYRYNVLVGISARYITAINLAKTALAEDAQFNVNFEGGK